MPFTLIYSCIGPIQGRSVIRRNLVQRKFLRTAYRHLSDYVGATATFLTARCFRKHEAERQSFLQIQILTDFGKEWWLDSCCSCEV